MPAIYTESDAFFAFSNIMVELVDGFLLVLDSAKNLETDTTCDAHT